MYSLVYKYKYQKYNVVGLGYSLEDRMVKGKLVVSFETLFFPMLIDPLLYSAREWSRTCTWTIILVHSCLVVSVIGLVTSLFQSDIVLAQNSIFTLL